LADGELTTVSGPFADTRQPVSAYAIISVDSLDDAIGRATDFLELHRKYWPVWEGAAEVRQIFGPNDPPSDG